MNKKHVDILNQYKKENRLLHWHWEEVRTEREERYLRGTPEGSEIERQRSVVDVDFYLKVTVNLPNSDQGTYRGKLSSLDNFESTLNGFIEKAKVSKERSWPIDQWEEPEAIPAVKPYDQKIIENPGGVADELVNEFNQEIQQVQSSTFNSAEIFVSSVERFVRASNRFSDLSKATRVYAEVCFSSLDTPDYDSQEFVVTKWGVHRDQIHPQQMCKDSVVNCNHLAKAEKMPSGKYSVLVGSEVLAMVFADVVSQMNVKRKYLSLPFLEVGTFLVNQSEGEYGLALDPTLPYGLQTTIYDSWGNLQQPVTLCSDNRVIHNIVDKQYGHYLDKKTTSHRGNIRLDAKKATPVEDLRKADGLVVEILQLSGLFTDPNTLTFSSEIRLAKVYDNTSGKVFYAKGGNLSGSFKENTRQLRLSKEQGDEHIVHFTTPGSGVSYFGPKWGLLNDVSVTS